MLLHGCEYCFYTSLTPKNSGMSRENHKKNDTRIRGMESVYMWEMFNTVFRKQNFCSVWFKKNTQNMQIY